MSLLAPGEFGHHPYLSSCWKSTSVMAREHLGLQVLMCYLGAVGKDKILRVVLKKCQLLPEKLV